MPSKKSKKEAKNIIRENADIIIEAFKKTPIKEFCSFMRGIRLGFKLCSIVLRDSFKNNDLDLNENIEHEEMLDIIKNIKTGGGEA